MNPVFCPANNQLDLSRLRLQFEGNFNANILAAITNGIQDWVNPGLGNLGVTIANLNLARNAADGQYVIYVGTGAAAGTKARQPERTLGISYMAPENGYLFTSDPNLRRSISHEFGHLLGLADRYYEGYFHNPNQAGTRTTVPMDGILFPAEIDYVPATNLMSGGGGQWTLSNAQRQLVLSCTAEGQKSRRVVGLFNATPQASVNWRLPPTMYLSGDALFTPDPPPPDLAIAGYTLLGGLVFIAKARATLLGNSAVRNLWNLRPPPSGAASRITWFHHGKKYKRKHVVSTAPRIHRSMMRLIGTLAAS